MTNNDPFSEKLPEPLFCVSVDDVRRIKFQI